MKSMSWMWRYVLRTITLLVLAAGLYGAAHADLRQQYGDGLWHDVGAGWQYRYDNAVNDGYWRYNGVVRFSLDYTPGQWSHFGTIWSPLSGTGFTDSVFIGDGAFHNLGSQWYFMYHSTYNCGYWNTGSANNYRFAYSYTPGKWLDYGTTWSALTGSGYSNAFIGDGNWHNLNNGWFYKFISAYNVGYWNSGNSATYRFAYDYTPRQWIHYGTTWSALTGSGYSNAFIGDGTSHNLGNGWDFTYAANAGTWSPTGTGTGRFKYDYSTAQWATSSAFTVGWAALGASGLSQVFIGDGAYHNLGNGFWYKYTVLTDDAYASLDGTSAGDRFYYMFKRGQWQHRSAMGGWYNLGAAGLSASFLGDGTADPLGNGFSYTYVGDVGTWTLTPGGAERFQYDYNLGQWSHKGASGTWQLLGLAAELADFIGDGTQHDLFNGFLYSYTGDQGYWTRGGAQRFKYDYAGGQWSSVGGFGGWNPLGATLQSAAFAGEGTFDLLNGFTFQYAYATDQGSFFQGATERFQYFYGAGLGEWKHYSLYGGWQSLATGLSSAFVGADGPHSLGNGWTYTYDEPLSAGFWLSDSLGFTKFSFDYINGQWYDHDKFGNPYQLGGLGNSLANFMGAGTQVLDATWSYHFDGTSGQWITGGLPKFEYAYDTGVWSHYGKVGAGFAISAAERTGRFVGDYTDVSPIDLGNGFSYWYDNVANIGHWLTGALLAARFDYNYGDGSWAHYGIDGVIFALSGINNSGKFLADYTAAAALALGNGFSYWYESGTGLGHWLSPTGTPPTPTARFDYNYGDGSWAHYGPTGGVFALSGTGNSVQFLGDYDSVTRLDLGNGFSYWYDGAGVGHWYSNTAGALRFEYNYGDGQWLHAGNVGGSFVLSALNQSAEFVGGVGSHLLGNGFSYSYAGDTATWTIVATGAARFEYTYGPGVWSHYDYAGTPASLTGAGANARFWGEGVPVVYDANFSYRYDAINDRGYFLLTGVVDPNIADRFGYDYQTGQWGDVVNGRGWLALGNAGQTLAFIGDGATHTLGGFTYQYLPDVTLAADKGSFFFDTNHQFRQTYTSGTWEYLHDTNLWSPWSAITAPPGTFAGISAAPTSAQLGTIAGDVWFIASNVIWSWDGNAFTNLSGATFASSVSLLGTTGTTAYFLGYGGSGTGYHIHSYDGTVFGDVSGLNNWGSTSWIGAIGAVPYFMVNGGTGHTGSDLFSFSGGTFNNLSNRGFYTMALLQTGTPGEFFFNANSGDYATNQCGLYSWNGTWNQRSSTTYSGPISYLTSLGADLLFTISGNQYGFPVAPYNMYSWNRTTSQWTLATDAGGGIGRNYSSIAYFGTTNGEAFFKIQGGTSGSGFDLASWDGTTWQELTNWNFSAINGNGVLGNSLWIIGFGGTNPDTLLAHTNNDIFVWDGAAFVQASSLVTGFSAPTTLLATVGNNAYFSLYGGTGHTGSDLFVLNGTTLTQASNYGVAPTFVTSLASDAFFRFTRPSPNYTDVYRWDGNALTNISNMAGTSSTFVTYLTTLLGDLYFTASGGTIGGTPHTGYDLFRWNAASGWTNVSNIGSSTMSYLSTLGPDLLFTGSGGTIGGIPHTGTDLFRWNGSTFENVSAAQGFTELTFVAQDGNTGFFFGRFGTTDRGIYRWNGTAFNRMGTAGPSSMSWPQVYTRNNGDLLFFQYGVTGGPTSPWFPSLLWNSYFDVLNSRI